MCQKQAVKLSHVIHISGEGERVGEEGGREEREGRRRRWRRGDVTKAGLMLWQL